MNEPESQNENIFADNVVTTSRQRSASRAMRFKLFSLFAMLIVVLLLMKEAGKPERWEWMGFDKAPATKAERTDVDAPAIALGSDSGADAEDIVAESNLSSSVGLTKTQNGQRETVSNSPQTIVIKQAGSYPPAAGQFWVKTFPALKLEQKKALFQLLKRVRDSKTGVTEQQSEFESLLDFLEDRRNEYHVQLLSEVSLLDSGSAAEKAKSAELHQSQLFWKETELPTLRAAATGEDFPVASQLSLAKLQPMLDPLILDDVIDLSSVGRAEDVIAWWRTWERVGEFNPARDGELAEPVTPIQLRAQPAAFRGELVSISGVLRTARVKPLENSKLDFDHFHELWIQPDGGDDLVCVYSNSAPSEFAKLTQEFKNLSEPVTVAGYFFKTRSYRDSKNKARHSPLILAKTFQWDPVVKTTVAKKAAMPSFSTFMMILGGMAVLATLIAWRVYSGSEHRAYQPGGKAADKIESTLKVLTDDPDIKSDAEKIKELYQ